jgi:3-hydroxyisobutyrate dehydrogenase
MSTLGEEATDWCAGLAGRYGAGFADAPVLGTREAAEKGELVVLASGPEEARSRVQPVFDAIGHRTIHVSQAEAGTRLKLVANSWVLAVVQTGAETVALAERLGVDPALSFQAIEGGSLDLPYLRTKAQAMADRDFRPSVRLSLPVLEAIARRFSQAATGHGDHDISATYLASLPERAA